MGVEDVQRRQKRHNEKHGIHCGAAAAGAKTAGVAGVLLGDGFAGGDLATDAADASRAYAERVASKFKAEVERIEDSIDLGLESVEEYGDVHFLDADATVDFCSGMV